MGKMQRTKGAGGEREIVNLLKAHGIPAQRISMMETGGIDKGDILVANTFKGQVKRGQFIPLWCYKAIEGFSLLFFRRDNKKWMVQMDLDTFVQLLK